MADLRSIEYSNYTWAEMQLQNTTCFDHLVSTVTLFFKFIHIWLHQRNAHFSWASATAGQDEIKARTCLFQLCFWSLALHHQSKSPDFHPPAHLFLIPQSPLQYLCRPVPPAPCHIATLSKRSSPPACNLLPPFSRRPSCAMTSLLRWTCFSLLLFFFFFLNGSSDK